MHLLLMFQLLLIAWFALLLCLADSLCSFFETKDSVTDDGGNETKTFHICPDISITSVKVFKGAKPNFTQPICRIHFEGDTCSTIARYCSCSKRTFSLTVEINSSDCAEWFIHGILKNGVSVDKTVNICLNLYQGTNTTPAPLNRSEASDATTPPSLRTELTTALESTTNAVDKIHDIRFFMLLGSIGVVALLIVGLCIVFGVFIVRRATPAGARPRSLPPPPPAPHNFRRAVADAVMFHAQAAGLRDSDSFNSTQGHDYVDIPDDTDLSKSDNSLSSVDSSPVSDSSMSDCLHHIACPSSDSSLPEDYLNPVGSNEKTSANVTKRPASDSSSSSEAVMYSGTII